MKEFIDNLEKYLSELKNYFETLDYSLEKINILTKTDELVFWLQMYQENLLNEESEEE